MGPWGSKGTTRSARNSKSVSCSSGFGILCPASRRPSSRACTQYHSIGCVSRTSGCVGARFLEGRKVCSLSARPRERVYIVRPLRLLAPRSEQAGISAARRTTESESHLDVAFARGERVGLHKK